MIKHIGNLQRTVILHRTGILHRAGIFYRTGTLHRIGNLRPACILTPSALAVLFLCILCSCSIKQNGQADSMHATSHAAMPADKMPVSSPAAMQSAKTTHVTPPQSPAIGQTSSAKIYPCWDVLGEQIPDYTFPQQIEELPPKNAFVWGGTVSHHLLAGNEIEQWFCEIAWRRKKIETFFIICPSHYGLSVQNWSLDECSWQTEYGIVQTNEKIERQISECLGVPYDPQVFQNEHGVSVLIPFIKKYYPEAKICTIAVNGEPPLNQADAQKLSEAISPYFTKRERKKNFLLISTDFSHHGNVERTEKTDRISRDFFKSPDSSSWINCGCDNRPGMYVLAKQLSPKTKACILYHTNSFELSGFGEDDITSYFFTLFY